MPFFKLFVSESQLQQSSTLNVVIAIAIFFMTTCLEFLIGHNSGYKCARVIIFSAKCPIRTHKSPIFLDRRHKTYFVRPTHIYYFKFFENVISSLIYFYYFDTLLLLLTFVCSIDPFTVRR